MTSAADRARLRYARENSPNRDSGLAKPNCRANLISVLQSETLFAEHSSTFAIDVTEP